MENHSEVFSKGEKTAKIGLVAVVFMGFVKGIAGFLSGSVSLLAQSLDSVTDVFSLVAVSLGMQLSKKPPSERFRYGYYRAETLVSLLVAILILLTGIQILRESASRILSPQPVSTPLVAVAVALLSIPVLYLLHQHMRRVGVEINSQSLINQAEDFKADMYTSIIVMVSVLSSMLGHYIVEGLAGSLISLQVLKLGGTLSWQALLVLMDAVIDPERIIQIKETAEKVRGVKEASRIRI